MTGITPARWLDLVHRVGAAALGVGLWVFGILGFINRLDYFSVRGETVLGLSSNGLLATISLVVGAVLIGAALRGGRVASTATMVIGALFLLSGLLNLAVLDTGYNLLAFRMPNVIFSFVAGMLLLFLGSYGRFSGGLPADNPYYQLRHPPAPGLATAGERGDVGGGDAELWDDDRWVAAEVAVAEGHPTPEQERHVLEDARRRAEEARRRAWELYEARQRSGSPRPS